MCGARLSCSGKRLLSSPSGRFACKERWHGCSNAEMMSNSTFLRPAGSKPASWSGRCLTFCDADAHHGEVVVGLGAVAVGLYLGGHGFYHLPG